MVPLYRKWKAMIVIKGVGEHIQVKKFHTQLNTTVLYADLVMAQKQT